MGSKITTEMVKELRGRTGAGVMDCFAALASCGGNQTAAEELIRKRRAAQPLESPTDGSHRAGVVHSYVHTGDRIGALVEVECTTDFAARTTEFRTFAHDLAMHVAALKPSWVSPEDAPWEEGSEDGEQIDSNRYLLLQPFIKDAGRTIGDLLAELSDRIGEPVAIRRFVRWEVGEDVPQDAAQPLQKPRGPLIAGAVMILLALAATIGLMLCA
jgi:elongation factor Ts